MTRPDGPPPEPDCAFPHGRPAVPAWARMRTTGGADDWASVWVEPPEGGLAVRLVDTTLIPHLAVMHLASGYSVINTRVGGAPITSNRKSRAACRAAMRILLDGVDWTGAMDQTDPNWWRARPLVERALAECLPAVPEWRAWRVSPRGIPYHHWFGSEAYAFRWAQADHASWWAVEHWPVPPGGKPRCGGSPLMAWSRGDAPLPQGMDSLTWRARGAVHVRGRDQTSLGPEPWGGWP